LKVKKKKKKKFNDFKKSEFLSSINVVGGTVYSTRKVPDGPITDYWSDETDKSFTDTTGQGWDVLDPATPDKKDVWG